MKKNYLKLFSLLSITILLIAGCQKEIKEEPANTLQNEEELQSRERHGDDDEDGCRLISNTSEFGQETFSYNRRGLLGEWTIADYGTFKQEYDGNGRLIKSKLYSEGVLLNTIKFFYDHDRIVKEIWYTGDTREKYDEVFYYYNRKGQIEKNVSYLLDYTNKFEYTRDGNESKWTIYFGNIRAYSSEYTYLHHHKNPFSAIPGVGNAFPYSNGVYNLNKWYSTSEKDIAYDEEGNAEVIVDQDPYRTIVRANRNDYVTASDFFDRLTQDYVHFRFRYDNCGHGHGNKSEPEQKLSPVANPKNNLLRLLKKESGKTMKEQVQEWKNQMKSMKAGKKI
jgi:YD repeat-containing protein